tara:strand:+ start:120 stop:236 length:117 start_codon:yes stop_codon:yes gene_type:complete
MKWHQLVVVCPCGVVGKQGGMLRWHFKNCRKLQKNYFF